MHKLDEALEIYAELKRDDPELDTKMVKVFIHKMSTQFIRVMHEMKYGCHITTEEMYNDAIRQLKWVEDRGMGAKWDVETILGLSKVDFEKSKYTKYDYCYVVNMLYSDFCNVFGEPSYYTKMAKNYLEDPDYTGDPSERAYKDACKKIEYKRSL